MRTNSNASNIINCVINSNFVYNSKLKPDHRQQLHNTVEYSRRYKSSYIHIYIWPMFWIHDTLWGMTVTLPKTQNGQTFPLSLSSFPIGSPCFIMLTLFAHYKTRPIERCKVGKLRSGAASAGAGWRVGGGNQRRGHGAVMECSLWRSASGWLRQRLPYTLGPISRYRNGEKEFLNGSA